MEKNLIRIGRVSAVDAESGAVMVTYHDRDDSVTEALPLLSEVYRMPKPGDLVLVLHLGTGTEAGVVLGKYWNEENKPPESGEDLFRVDFDSVAFLRCQGGTVTLMADGVTVNGDLILNGSLTVSGSITAGGDVVAGGVSLLNHTH